MSIVRSNGRHKADSSFDTITRVPRISVIPTVLMMCINKRINTAHHCDARLEAPQKHLGYQIKKKDECFVVANQLVATMKKAICRGHFS